MVWEEGGMGESPLCSFVRREKRREEKRAVSMLTGHQAFLFWQKCWGYFTWDNLSCLLWVFQICKLWLISRDGRAINSTLLKEKQ